MPEDKTYLNNLRHSAAHLLAAAVTELYPGAKPTIGPPIETGFYYDFEFQEPILEDDLPKIETKMRELLGGWSAFTRRKLTGDEAKEFFDGNQYKIELINELQNKGEEITVYTSGNFTDLCRGGHVENPKQELGGFKLISIAGAYWRGNEKNAMLTRVYGTAFQTQKELDDYLKMREEAKKRDHKKLGKELGLFIFSDLVGPGLPLFTGKGEIIKHELEKFMRKEKEALGYTFVHIPHIAKAKLYQKSGHMGKYDAMMPVMTDSEGDEFVIKPMNCPHHFELYKGSAHSYRELPIRYAETTAVYRNEKSGELSGLVRVKGLTQDDTHHFIRHDQIESEIKMILSLMQKTYRVFGLDKYTLNISVRDPKHKERYFGNDALWAKAEEMLILAVKNWGVPYTIAEGEAAFYGPKIDITINDSLGRPWQLTTVQLDFNQPENFDLFYISDLGKKERPAVIHCTILGAIERFMGILIEHYAGAFPFWLAPAQIIIAPVSLNHIQTASLLKEYLLAKNAELRIEIDESGETVGAKIRNSASQKIPYTIVIGDKEATPSGVWEDSAMLSVRRFGSREPINESLKQFSERIIKEGQKHYEQT